MSAHDFVTLGKSLNISEPVSPPAMEMGSPELTGSLKVKCTNALGTEEGSQLLSQQRQSQAQPQALYICVSSFLSHDSLTKAMLSDRSTPWGQSKQTPSGRSCLPAHFPAEPTAATHRAVVPAQLLLAPEAHVQPVARHVQVL